MARGRYAAKASKRRAESAEEQLDRLLPQLVDAKRIAKQYKAEAERVPVLTRQLAELKDKVGVPLDQYEAALRGAAAEFDAMCSEYEAAVRLLCTRMLKTRREWAREDMGDPAMVDTALLEALIILGLENVQPLLQALNWERWNARHLVSIEAINRWNAKKERERKVGLVQMNSQDPLARGYAKWKSDKYRAAAAEIDEEDTHDQLELPGSRSDQGG